MRKFILGAVIFFALVNSYAGKIIGFVPSTEYGTEASPHTIFDETVYSKCILENTKKQSITTDIRQACKVLATPYSCRNLLGKEFLECKEKCNNSNFYSKNFGECRLN